MKRTPAAAARLLVVAAAIAPCVSASRLHAAGPSRLHKEEQFLSSGSFVTHHQEDFDGALARQDPAFGADNLRPPPINWKRIARNGTAWVVGVTLAVVGTIAYLIRSGQKASADDAITEADEKSKAVVETSDSGPPQQKFNYEELLRAMALCAAHQVGPKLTKGLKAKRALEQRVSTMTVKAREFVIHEFRSVAGTMLRELEVEEAMLLLDFEHSTKFGFPSLSILLAGTISPLVLAIAFYFHVVQIVVMFLPLMMLAAWAIFKDMDSVCGIPTIYFWVVVQGCVCFILAIAHGISAYRVYRGGHELLQKARESQKVVATAKQSHGDLDATEVQRLFISNSALLQHGLVIEDQVRQSVAYMIVGYGTIAWMGLTLWTFILVFGWTLFPGVMAFHPKAQGVAPEHQFCSALATVFTARLSCALAFFFLFINSFQLLQFVSQRMVDSPRYRMTLLGIARKIDRKTVGIPIAELLVRALLLRGCADTLDHKILEAQQEKHQVEREHAALVAKLSGVEARIQACKKEAGDFRELESHVSGCVAASKEAEDHVHAAELKVKEKMDQVQLRASVLAEESQGKLEEALKKLLELISQMKDSDTMQKMLQDAQQLAADAQAKASEMAQNAQDWEKVQHTIERTTTQAREAMHTAADAVQNSDSYQVGVKRLQELQQSEEFQKGLDSVQEAYAKGAKMVDDGMQSEEFKKGLAAAQEMSKEAAAKATKVAEDVKQSEQFKKGVAAATDAAGSASSAAQSAVDQATEKGQKGGWLGK